MLLDSKWFVHLNGKKREREQKQMWLDGLNGCLPSSQYENFIHHIGTQLIDILIYERGVGFSFLNNFYG